MDHSSCSRYLSRSAKRFKVLEKEEQASLVFRNSRSILLGQCLFYRVICYSRRFSSDYDILPLLMFCKVSKKRIENISAVVKFGAGQLCP